MKDFFRNFIELILYSETDSVAFNYAYYHIANVLVFILFIGVLLLVLLDPKIRKHKRPEDKYMFGESILLVILLGLRSFLSAMYYIVLASDLIPDVLYEKFIIFGPYAWELVYYLVIMQWTVFVDYSLYRSMDHIRRRYKLAFLPILVIIVLQGFQTYLLYFTDMISEAVLVWDNICIAGKEAIAFGYVIAAIVLVVRYQKESRQPRLLRLSAFIIPFVLGAIFRYYDAPLIAIGVLLTFLAVARRDRYLDHETGFYNKDFLGYISKYRDKKNYDGGNGILIHAPGRKEDMAAILKEISPPDSNVFILEGDHFLLLNESLLGSAEQMAVQMFIEAAETCDPPFTPEVRSIQREEEETATDFANRLLAGINSAAPKEVAL